MKVNFDSIKNKIIDKHSGDSQQLKVIFSENNRIMVEAPAGYGKTTTIISRLAYLLSTNSIPNPKKVLVLTFSVNAALKIKKDVSSQLPELMGIKNNPNYVSKYIDITNYHGFCKSVLKKYGFLYNIELSRLDELQAISDEDIYKFRLPDLKNLFVEDEILTIKQLDDNIRKAQKLDENLIKKYNKIISQKLISKEKITHNSIITITLELFARHPNIKKFYSLYYSLIVIDEFQDTNIIAWRLIHCLINENTKLLFVGDSLQRIYGFIGAYQGIMEKAARIYKMETIALTKNYRFKDNPEMLMLDNNIRKNAQNFNNPNITEIANLPYHFSENQQGEAVWVCSKVKNLLDVNNKSKIAILVKQRGKNTDLLENELKEARIDYFYAIYRDDDEEYIEFHRRCLEVFNEMINKRNNLSKQLLYNFVKKVSNIYKDSDSQIHKSLLILLNALTNKIMSEYIDLDPEDRILFLKDIFENRQLKQAMDYVPARVILATVHSAKGLEWDYVILPDVERRIMPHYSTCRYCLGKGFSKINNGACVINENIDKKMQEILLEELCVFYVAITRAKKQVFISSSKERFINEDSLNDSVLSCLPNLDGINLILE